MVSAMDDQIGLVTAALESTGQLNNTVIVFTADNGAPFGDAFEEPPYLWDASRPSRPPNGTHGGGGGSNWPSVNEQIKTEQDKEKGKEEEAEENRRRQRSKSG